MKVKVRKKSAPTEECRKLTNENEIIPFLTYDIGGYRHRKEPDEVKKMFVDLHRKIQSLKRI